MDEISFIRMIYTESKNCVFFFLSKLRQISTTFNNFWYMWMVKCLKCYAVYALPPHLTHVTALPC